MKGTIKYLLEKSLFNSSRNKWTPVSWREGLDAEPKDTLGKSDHWHPSLWKHPNYLWINAALGTVTGNNTNVPLDHELPFGPSGQICHFSWSLGWPQLIIPALCGARRCQEMSQGTPCPSLTPLSAGWGFLLVWGFFCVYSQTPLCIHFSLFQEKLSQMFCCPSAVAVWLKEAVSSQSLNLAIIVFQTRLSAVFGIFSYLACLEGS